MCGSNRGAMTEWERERWVGLNGEIGCTQSVRYQLNYCTLGLFPVAMDTSQRRDEYPGEFLRVFWENCQMTSLPAVTVVTALTSGTSRRCCLQVDLQPSRLQRTRTPRQWHVCEGFLLSASTLPGARSSSTDGFFCMKYLYHAFGNFQFTQCIGFPIFSPSYNAKKSSGSGECINLRVSKAQKCAEFFRGCKDWENISLSTDKYLD